MGDSLYFVIPGHPIPAVRMTQKSKWVNPRAIAYLDYKQTIGMIAKVAAKGRQFENAVVDMKVYFMGNGGDVDNYIKSVLDGCNGVLWKDDRLVTKVFCCKYKVNNVGLERIEVEVNDGETV